MSVHAEALEFHALDDSSWRLCDTSAADRDASSLVAYVERTAWGYEVVWLQGICAQTSFPSLDAVMASARALDGRVASAQIPVMALHTP